MEEFTNNLREKLFVAGELSEVVLNANSLFVILFGVVLSLNRTFRDSRLIPGPHPRHTVFRRNFGGWLVVALEFQLAADIVGTIISPSYEELIRLGAIAVIRTFLNYFLNKELNEQAETSRIEIEKPK